MENSSLEFYFTGEQIIGAIGAKIAVIKKLYKKFQEQADKKHEEAVKSYESRIVPWKEYDSQLEKYNRLFILKIFFKKPKEPSGFRPSCLWSPSYFLHSAGGSIAKLSAELMDLQRDIHLFNDQEEYLLTKEQAYFYGLPEYFSGCGPGK